LEVQDQQDKKSLRDPISTNKKLGAVVFIYPLSYTGSIKRRIVDQAGMGINNRPYPQNNESRKGWEHDSSGRAPA
jgi:hypothetical protein